MSLPPFHLAFPVLDIERSREFYTRVLGCTVGREDRRWIDFNFAGHQITGHLIDQPEATPPTNEVDGKQIPVRHFGLVLAWNDWQALAERLISEKVAFLVEPHIRFPGEVGEQATLFLLDPSGNGLEFKAFKNPARLFARSDSL